LDLYLSVVEELAEENGCDVAEIAAAAAFLGAGDKPLEVVIEPEPQQFSFKEDGMVRLFLDIGRNHQISPGDIVGAIANEANVPGKAIGAIDIYDRFTLVDVPSEFAGQVIDVMGKTRIRSQKANIRLAAPHELSEDKPRRAGAARGRDNNRDKGGKKGKKESYKGKKKYSKR
jgi:ATP-dependent RNA helicase DeaD